MKKKDVRLEEGNIRTKSTSNRRQMNITKIDTTFDVIFFFLYNKSFATRPIICHPLEYYFFLHFLKMFCNVNDRELFGVQKEI